MRQPVAILTKKFMITATGWARARMAGWLRLAQEVSEDARKDERLARHECKACFYPTRVGGAAMTHRDCMRCGVSQIYNSTVTDVLCLSCATELDLCKHCGGDLEMRAERTEVFVPASGENKTTVDTK